MEISSQLTIKGRWKFEVRDVSEFIEKGIPYGKGDGKLTHYSEKDNLIPTVGKNAHADQIASDNTVDIGDNKYIALGDDNTAPAAGDTTLGNETTRKAISSDAAAANVATIAVFFAATEATGTHEEFGLFGDGSSTTASASADSGILYSHVTDTVTVSASETLTVTFSITYS